MFITFEGIEGSGKSTLIRLLNDTFTAHNYEVCITREPGGSSLGSKIRPILLSEKEEKVCSQAELLLFLADRAEHVEKIIKPALKAKKIILCDRYIHSTLAYQGYARGLDIPLLKQLNAFAIGTCTPDITFLLDIDVHTGLQRAKSRNNDAHLDEGKFEAEETNFHEKVRQGFLDMAQEDKKIIILDAHQSPEHIRKLAWESIESIIFD